MATSLVEYLDQSARTVPRRTAVVDPEGGSLTYAELADAANRVAGFLIDAGISTGDRVGIVQPKRQACERRRREFDPPEPFANDNRRDVPGAAFHRHQRGAIPKLG